MFDIFVEVSVTELVELCLVFVVTAVEASDARMKRVLNNGVRVRLPKLTRRWGLRNIIYKVTVSTKAIQPVSLAGRFVRFTRILPELMCPV
jgi:hypothetical protein